MAEEKQKNENKTNLRDVRKYPLIIAFFAFLVVFTIADIIAPDRQESELQNSKLKQKPKFSFQSFAENKWTKEYDEYTREQVLFREGWLKINSAAELAQGKLESGGVWFAKDGYQIAKNTAFSSAQKRLIPLNTEVVEDFAKMYPGKVTVMIVPSPANIMSDKLKASPPQVDENLVLDEMFSKYAAAGAKTVDLRPIFTIKEAAGEQIYYRTDHHWTTDGGAWLAYNELCNTLGIDKINPNDYIEKAVVPDFYGTNYSKTVRVGTKADELAYYPFSSTMTIQKADGTIQAENVPVMDYEKLEEYDKYAAFLHGNNGYSEIEGSGEGSILVIKDSYGNSFVPYLTQNYGKIGVIDLRAWNSVAEVMAKESYDEILVLYSFSIFSEDTAVNKMLK